MTLSAQTTLGKENTMNLLSRNNVDLQDGALRKDQIGRIGAQEVRLQGGMQRLGTGYLCVSHGNIYRWPDVP